MVKQAFTELADEFTAILDFYEKHIEEPKESGSPDKKPVPGELWEKSRSREFTKGEQLFTAQAYQYLSRDERSITLGFARMLKILTRYSHLQTWREIVFEEDEFIVVTRTNPEWNAYKSLAHKILEFEEYNSKVKQGDNRRATLTLMMCTQCARIIVTEAVAARTTCSDQCRVHYNRIGIHLDGEGEEARLKPLLGNGSTTEGNRRHTEFSRYLAERSALVVIRRLGNTMLPGERESAFSNFPIKRHNSLNISRPSESKVLEWLETTADFDILRVDDSSGGEVPAGQFEIYCEKDWSKFRGQKSPRTKAEQDKITSIEEELEDLFEAGIRAYSGKTARRLKNQLKEFDPNNPFVKVKLQTGAVSRRKRLTDKTSSSSVKWGLNTDKLNKIKDASKPWKINAKLFPSRAISIEAEMEERVGTDNDFRILPQNAYMVRLITGELVDFKRMSKDPIFSQDLPEEERSVNLINTASVIRLFEKTFDKDGKPSEVECWKGEADRVIKVANWLDTHLIESGRDFDAEYEDYRAKMHITMKDFFSGFASKSDKAQ